MDHQRDFGIGGAVLKYKVDFQWCHFETVLQNSIPEGSILSPGAYSAYIKLGNY